MPRRPRKPWLPLLIARMTEAIAGAMQEGSALADPASLAACQDDAGAPAATAQTYAGASAGGGEADHPGCLDRSRY